MKSGKKVSKVVSLWLCIALLLCNSTLVFAGDTTGRVYYVSAETGVDAEANGSINAPFKTIQYAADRMNAGDICIIKKGVYRETVTVDLTGNKENPIVFRAAEGEDVVITGCEEITGWTNYQGNIYTADMNWDMYSGEGNMIFADGELCQEARWPNTENFLDINTYSTVDYVNTTDGFRIVDSALPTDVDLSDGMIGIASGNGYYSIYGDIVYHDTASDTIRYTMPGWVTGGYLPTVGNTFYITRTLAALDVEKEWYKDVSGDKLYFMAPGKVDPDEISVEAKKREYALDLSGASYVTVEGINIKGANIKTDAETNNCSIKNCVIEAMDYRLTQNEQGQASAIIINGNNNTVTGCEIKNSYGGGIRLGGSYNRVINNSIHDLNLQHTNKDSGVYITGSHQLVSHNSIYNLGREAIGGRFARSVISYNDLHDGDLISKDGGIIYLSNNNYQDSEIHHNLVYNNYGAGFQAGIYYDNSASGLITYNNVVYNINGRPLVLNAPHSNSIVANNTFAVNNPIECWPATDKMSNIKIFNNVFYSSRMFDSDVVLAEKGIVYDKNLLNANGKLNADFTPLNNSDVIDNAINIPGITTSSFGSNPDCGAYEYGTEKWTAGCNLTVDCDEEFELNAAIPFKNVLDNTEFESGLSKWSVESGDPTVLTQSAWSFDDLFSILGSKSVVLKSGDKISQRITGLKPNTTYTFSVGGKISGDFIKATDYKALGGSFQFASAKAEDVLYKIDNGDYAVYSIDFGDGIYNTISLGAHSIPRGTSQSVKKLGVYLDSLNGTKIAEYNNSLISNDFYNGSDDFIWKEKSISSISGVHNVYIKFEGDFDKGAFGGIILNSTSNSDSVKISAQSGENVSAGTITATDWKVIPDSIDIVTDALGIATVAIEKEGGNYRGYIDDLSFIEKYTPGEEISGIYVLIDSIKYMDIYGNESGMLKKNAINVVEVTARNTRAGVNTITGRLESCYSDGTIYDSCEILKTFDGQETGSFGVGLSVPDEDNAYLLLSLIQDGGTIEYKITDGTFENESGDYGEIAVKGVSVVNSSGKELDLIRNNETNTVLVTLENQTNEPLDIYCFAALYDSEGAFLDIEVADCKSLLANETKAVKVADLDVPKEGTYYIKLGFWNSITQMSPYCRLYSFK